jgi:hypothetical protein
MKNDPLTQYARLRQEVVKEKEQLEARLAEINAVLQPEMQIPSGALGKVTSEHVGKLARAAKARPGRKPSAGNSMSMREAVVKALSKGPVARKDLVKAVEGVGYKFTTKNPLNSIGSVLYAKNSPIKNKDGKFYVEGGATLEGGSYNGSGIQADTPRPAKKKKRKLTAEGRARISAAATARWARQKAGK